MRRDRVSMAPYVPSGSVSVLLLVFAVFFTSCGQTTRDPQPQAGPVPHETSKVTDISGVYTGTIGDLPVVLTLENTGGQLSGSYFYKKIGRDIALAGALSENTFTMTETDEGGRTTGTFSGTADSGGNRLTGEWKSANGARRYSFSFTRPQDPEVTARPGGARFPETAPWPPASGVIEGVVRRADTAQPLEGVTIQLWILRDGTWGPADSNVIPPVKTDARGHFAFSKVPPNRYLANAWRDGYFGPLEAYRTNRAPGSVRKRVIPAADGNSRGLIFELLPGAIIRGRVLRPNGAPAARVPVAAATWGYEAGRRTLLFHSQATTNANGDYALPAIVRGEYFILADDRRSTFSFATPEKLRAEAVTVAAGETRHVDLIVNEDASAAQGPRFTVSGRVEFPPARPEARGFAGIQEATLLLADRNDPRDPAQAGWDAKINRFEFRDVAPGSYDLFATGFLDEHFGPPVTDRKTIEVSNANVEGIGMSVRRGPDMRSRWLVDGKPSGKDGNPLHCLWFRVNDATRFSFDVTPDRQGRIHPNDLESRWDQGKGEFVTEGVPPGIYSVDLSPCSPYYLADVRQGGKSVIDEGFLVGRDNAQPIELLIRTDGGSIQGIVQDAGGKPVPGAVVALVPPLSRRSNWNLYAHTVSNEEDGSFTFGYGFNPVVAPGEYKLFAWKKVPEGAWTNAEFLARYERYGQTITVIPGASASARVQLAPDPR